MAGVADSLAVEVELADDLLLQRLVTAVENLAAAAEKLAQAAELMAALKVDGRLPF